MRNLKARTLAAAAIVFASTLPAWAGSVYVPLAKDVTINGIRYRTEVLVSNKGDVARRFSTYFISTETDGTFRPNGSGEENQIGVNPLSTLLLTGVAPSGVNGMLEITGAPQITVHSRLIATVNGVDQLGASIPTLSSDTLIPADTQIQLVNLERSSSRRSDFVLVNLAHEAAICNVSVFQANGSQVGNAVEVGMAPLSHRQFSDVLNLLGLVGISAVRFQIACSDDFYAYALNFDTASGEATVITPAEDLDSTLAIPGGGTPPPPPGDCDASATFCFQRAGIFYSPNRSETVRRESFAIPPGSYAKTRMRVKVFHGGWLSPPSGLHSLFWYALGGRHFRLIGFAGALGPGKDQVLFRHGMNLEAGVKPKFTPAFAWVPGLTYTMDYLWDPSTRTVDFKILDSAGNVLERITDRANVNRMNVEAGEDLTLDFSTQQGQNPNEPSTFGWNYSDLIVEVWQ